MSDHNVPVTVYTISTCVHCKALKRMLSEHKITFEATDVDLMEEKAKASLLGALRKYNEKETFPVIIIGNKAIIGFQKEVIQSELGIQ